MVFVARNQPQQVTIGLRPEALRLVPIIIQDAIRKDPPTWYPVFAFQPVERGQGHAVSAIEMSQGLKNLGFALMIRALPLRFGVPGIRAPGSRRSYAIWDGKTRDFRVLGLWLRQWILAYNFVNSHRCLLNRQCWLGRVRCSNTGRRPSGLCFWFC